MMDTTAFKQRMQNLKSYRENNPGKGYWDWKVQSFAEGGESEEQYDVTDTLRGYYSNHTGTPTMYVPLTKDYEATPESFGEIVNVHTPEVTITPKDNISLEAAIDKGKREGFKIAAPIVGGAALASMSAVGGLGKALDLAGTISDPLDPLNYIDKLKINKIVSRGLEKINPYLFSRNRLYSDNPIVNAYATVARRYNLPDKARLPYLIRRVNSENLKVTDNGDVILGGDRLSHVNFTYDMPVMPHEKGIWDAAPQTLIINPRNIIKNNRWGSIEPSDMFNIKGSITVKPTEITNITANPISKRFSNKLGIQTVSSTDLKLAELKQLQLEQKAFLENFNKKFKFAKDGRNSGDDRYWESVQQIQQKFGRPKTKDVQLLENLTDLKSYIQPIEDVNLFRTISQDVIKKTPISQTKQLINNLPVYNNGRRFKYEGWSDYKNVNRPYKNFFYDPATQVESLYDFSKYAEGGETGDPDKE